MTEPAVADLAALPSAASPMTAAAPAGRRPALPTIPTWWRHAVIYEIYVRSFADGNGDGTGDLAGVRARLPYLRDLGVDAIWFTPWYVSPLADGGYDVADYRAIDPAFGTLEEAEALIADALALGIRTIIDIVPNHVSDQHPWFQAALAAGPGLARARPLLVPPGPRRRRRRAADRLAVRVPGRRRGAARPIPTDGPATGTSTCSRPSSPTSTGTTRTSAPSTRRSCASGSIAARPASASTRPRSWSRTRRCPRSRPSRRPGGTRPRTATSSTTSIAAGAPSPTRIPGTRVLVGELWLADIDRFAEYLRPDELHTAFNFDFMARPWRADDLRDSIDATLAAHAPVGAPATWVLSNHDVTRPVTPLRPGGHVVRLPPQAVRRRDRPRTRPTAGTGGRAAHRRAARLPLHLPGRRARPRRGRGPDRRDPGPDARPLGWHRTRAATAAACRCPGAAPRRRSGSARPIDRPRRG